MTKHKDGRLCPKCGGESEVEHTERLTAEIKRYRRCLKCRHPFVTHQPMERFIRDVDPYKDSTGGMSRLTGILKPA